MSILRILTPATPFVLFVGYIQAKGEPIQLTYRVPGPVALMYRVPGPVALMYSVPKTISFIYDMDE